MSDVEKLLGDLVAKVNAQGASLEGRMAEIESGVKASGLTRKMAFGGDTNTAGSKFQGLTSADVQLLHDIVKSNARNTGRGPSEELTNAYEHVSNHYIASTPKGLDAVPYRKATQNEGASGYGQQLVGVQYVGELWDAARQQSKVFGLLDTFQMLAPSAYLPVVADLPEPVLSAENKIGRAHV